MKPSEVIEHFGTQEKAAKALGTTQPRISTWVTAGKVPKLRQFQIQVLTNGKLKAEVE